MKREWYIGHKFQLYGVEEYVLNKGKGKGSVILHVKNGLGLELYINTDRGFDISMLTYKGDSLSYLSPNGYVASQYYDDKGSGFLKSFTAGFLTTCGLTQVGSPNIDSGEELPLHGTYSNIPCSNYIYEDNNDFIMLKGIVLDETIFSHKLMLVRKIIISKLTNDIKIIDEITNNGDQQSPLEILYHINLGYPLLDENLIIESNSINVEARNKHAEEYIKMWNKMIPPQEGFEEMCYYHTFKEKEAYFNAYNSRINKGIKISFNIDQLSFLTEWKMLGIRDYVLGLEPGNCTADGRKTMREKGILEFIESNETKVKEVNIHIYEK